MSYNKEIKAIKLLQDRSNCIQKDHDDIFNDLKLLKKELNDLCDGDIPNNDIINNYKKEYIEKMSSDKKIENINIDTIYKEAEEKYSNIKLSDIITNEDFNETNKRINLHIEDFNKKYNLDKWDYAISGGCGLFCAMLDLLCIRAPLKPTASWDQQVNGIFNQWTQKAFNTLIPPDLSSQLCELNKIGSADVSTTSRLINAPAKAVNPYNHRLRSLSHDPILGFIFGVLDMMRGTCTVVVDGKIMTMQTTSPPIDGSIFQLLGRMFGHLLSDVNAPTSHGNRGMGLPAPFMGLLRMFDSIPVGDSTFGKQIEYMYINGYDFRQFISTSIPIAIMEVLMRCFYIAKQINIYNYKFIDALSDTIPMKMNPRFRTMLTIGFGTISAINGAKMYITQNIMNANYAAWLGLVWNGFHSLKWAICDKHFELWSYVEKKEYENLIYDIENIEKLENRARYLPI